MYGAHYYDERSDFDGWKRRERLHKGNMEENIDESETSTHD